jgi:hypothetical protein
VHRDYVLPQTIAKYMSNSILIFSAVVSLIQDRKKCPVFLAETTNQPAPGTVSPIFFTIFLHCPRTTVNTSWSSKHTHHAAVFNFSFEDQIWQCGPFSGRGPNCSRVYGPSYPAVDGLKVFFYGTGTVQVHLQITRPYTGSTS